MTDSHPPLNEFLPTTPEENWAFRLDRNQLLFVKYKSDMQANRRLVSLELPSEHKPNFFFDRMESSDGTLALTRVRGHLTYPIEPPLVITSAAGADFCPNIYKDEVFTGAVCQGIAGQKKFELVTYGDFPLPVWTFNVKVSAKNPQGTILANTRMVFRQDIGLNEIHSEFFGVWYSYFRELNPPGTPPPVSIPPQRLLDLRRNSKRNFQVRGQPAGSLVEMIVRKESEERYAFQGSAPTIFRNFLTGSSGVHVSIVNLWGKPVTVFPPLQIAGPRVTFDASSAFTWKPSSTNSIIGPDGRPVRSLELRGTWRETPQGFEWAQTVPPNFPFAGLKPYYLFCVVDAVSGSGTAIPRLEEVLVVHESIGVFRIASRTGSEPEKYWDLTEYPTEF